MNAMEFVTWLQKQIDEEKPLTIKQAIEIERNAAAVEWWTELPNAIDDRATGIAAFAEGAFLGVDKYGCSDEVLRKVTVLLKGKITTLFSDAAKSGSPDNRSASRGVGDLKEPLQTARKPTTGAP